MNTFTKLATLLLISIPSLVLAGTYELCVQQATIVAKDRYDKGPSSYHDSAKRIFENIQPKVKDMVLLLRKDPAFFDILIKATQSPKVMVPLLREKIQENKAPYDTINNYLKDYDGEKNSYVDGFMEIKFDKEKNGITLTVCDLKNYLKNQDAVLGGKKDLEFESVKVCSAGIFFADKKDGKITLRVGLTTKMSILDVPPLTKRSEDNKYNYKYNSVSKIDGIDISLSENDYVESQVKEKCGEPQVASNTSKINGDARSSTKEVNIAAASIPSKKSQVTKQ